MSTVNSGNRTHDTTCNQSEGVRQVSVAAATTQAAVNTAEILHYRNCLASALANNCGVQPFMSALRSLGVTGQ